MLNFTCNKLCFTSIQKYRFTQALKIVILVSFCIVVDIHTYLNLENNPLAFSILTLTSVLAPLSTATTLPK
jgi:hypothetical protein